MVTEAGVRGHIMQHIKLAEGISLMHFRSMELTFCHSPNAIAFAAVEISIGDLIQKYPDQYQNLILDMP